MELLAEWVAMAIEFIMIATIVIGTLRAVARIFRCLLEHRALTEQIRQIWLHYASWILLALELALAADLIRTVIAPDWQEIGQLGAIAALRIALGYFLGRDIDEIKPRETDQPSTGR